jgi:hypothetical protein
LLLLLHSPNFVNCVICWLVSATVPSGILSSGNELIE